MVNACICVEYMSVKFGKKVPVAMDMLAKQHGVIFMRHPIYRPCLKKWMGKFGDNPVKFYPILRFVNFCHH